MKQNDRKSNSGYTWGKYAVSRNSLSYAWVSEDNSGFTRQVFLLWLFQEVQKLTTVSELEQFMMEYGEQIIDVLGQQVDRIEKNIKVRLVKLAFIWVTGSLLATWTM